MGTDLDGMLTAEADAEAEAQADAAWRVHVRVAAVRRHRLQAAAFCICDLVRQRSQAGMPRCSHARDTDPQPSLVALQIIALVHNVCPVQSGQKSNLDEAGLRDALRLRPDGSVGLERFCIVIVARLCHGNLCAGCRWLTARRSALPGRKTPVRNYKPALLSAARG